MQARAETLRTLPIARRSERVGRQCFWDLGVVVCGGLACFRQQMPRLSEQKDHREVRSQQYLAPQLSGSSRGLSREPDFGLDVEETKELLQLFTESFYRLYKRVGGGNNYSPLRADRVSLIDLSRCLFFYLAWLRGPGAVLRVPE